MSDDISIPSPTYRVHRRRQGMDPGTRRLALIAGGLGGALALMIGVWSMTGNRPQGIPVVQAQPGPVRVKPVNPGGLQVPGVGNDIFSGGSDTKVDKLAPAPEVPNLQALRPPPPPPKPAVAAEASTVMPPAPPPSAVAERPAAVPLPRPQPQPAQATARIAPHPAETPAMAERRPAPPAPVARSGATMVQLAALSTEEAARIEWRNLARRAPGLLGGRQPEFSMIRRGSHVFWRVRTGGFADAAQARAFCARLRGKGLACSVADF